MTTTNSAAPPGPGHNLPPYELGCRVPHHVELTEALQRDHAELYEEGAALDRCYHRWVEGHDGRADDDLVAGRVATLIKMYRRFGQAFDAALEGSATTYRSVLGAIDTEKRRLRELRSTKSAHLRRALDAHMRRREESRPAPPAPRSGSARDRESPPPSPRPVAAHMRRVERIEIVGDIDWSTLGPYVTPAARDRAIRAALKDGAKIAGVRLVAEERTVVR